MASAVMTITGAANTIRQQRTDDVEDTLDAAR